MRTSTPSRTRRGAHSKVTYSLPAEVAREVDRRSKATGLAKSELVREALTAYFASSDREELVRVFRQAAADPLFTEDNAAVEADFAVLDNEVTSGAGR